MARFSGAAARQRTEREAQPKHVDDHLQPVADHMDFGAALLPPADSNLHDPQPGALRATENFDVERKARQQLLREERRDGRSPKQLEAALRVVDRADQQRADERAKEESEQPPVVQRIDLRWIEDARADRDIGSMFERVLEGVDLGKRRRAVGVDEHAAIGAGCQQAGADGRAFALMGRKGDHAKARNLRDPLPCEIGRAVTRAVVSHEDLNRPAAIARPHGDLVDRPA